MDVRESGRSAFKLQNVEVQHRKHPDSFEIAPRRARAQLRPYDLAKVILLLDPPPPFGPKAERLWVMVTRVEADGRYVGKLDNEPVLVRAKLGDEIRFGPEHIANFDIRMALVEPVPSKLYPGYTHPVGRHVSIVGGNAKELMVKVHVPPSPERNLWWKEHFLVADSFLSAITKSDPLMRDARLN